METASAAESPAGFDDLILRLHDRLLWDSDGPEAALRALAPIVAHTAAWLGHAANPPGAPPQLYAEAGWNLAPDFTDQWHRIRQYDTLARGLALPGDHGLLTLRRDTPRPLRGMMERNDIGQALCVTAPGLLSQGFMFLTLYRPLGAPGFADPEITRARLFVRHLGVALRNRLRLGPLADDLIAATATLQGRLDRASEAFLGRMRAAGLRMDGSQLPAPLWRRLHDRGALDCGAGRLELRRFFGLRLLVWTEGSAPPTALSAREDQVARIYAGGGSFRDVARLLDISPHTARNHLRTVYRKLDIGSKLDLARLLHAVPRGGAQ